MEQGRSGGLSGGRGHKVIRSGLLNSLKKRKKEASKRKKKKKEKRSMYDKTTAWMDEVGSVRARPFVGSKRGRVAAE